MSGLHISKHTYVIFIHIRSYRIHMNSGTVLWRSWGTGFTPSKGGIKLVVLSDLSVWVFISYQQHISYIIWGRNAKMCVYMHLGTMARHIPLPLPSDLEKSCHQHKSYIIWHRNPKFGLWTHLRVTEVVPIQFSGNCDLDFWHQFLKNALSSVVI